MSKKKNSMEEIMDKIHSETLRMLEELAVTEMHGQSECVNNSYHKTFDRTLKGANALCRIRNEQDKQCRANGRVYDDEGGMWDVSHFPKIGEERVKQDESGVESVTNLEERIKQMSMEIALYRSREETRKLKDQIDFSKNADEMSGKDANSVVKPRRNGILRKVFGD